MVITLILGALAVFWAWEFVLVLSPWQVPPVLQPLLVAGLGYLASTLSHEILLPAAIAGGVGLLHALVRTEAPTQVLQLPRSGRRSELGSRIPGLP